MHTSIRTRTILAMNLLAAGVAVGVGWAAIRVSNRAVERRLVGESVANAAGLVGQMNLPVSDSLVSRLGEILGTELVAADADGRRVASSFAPDAPAPSDTLLAEEGPPSRAEIGGIEYAVGAAEVRFRAGRPARPVRLLLLLPLTELRAAQWRAARSIAIVAVVAVVLATALAAWLSTGIARPIRWLADRMDRLSAAAAAGGAPEASAAPDAGRAGPAEVLLLAESFGRLLAALSEARDKLAKAARLAALGEVSGSVAHELRNPLSGIRMNAQVLGEELRRAGLNDRSLDLIVREIDRMDASLRRLLRAGESRVPDGGAAAPEAGRCDLNAAVESALALAVPRAGGQVEVRRELAADLPPAAAPEPKVREVVLNLLNNALEAMASGGGRLQVRTAAATGSVRFAVTDEGGGLAVPAGADPFEPFVTTKAAGTGLGLHICRRVVEAHGGRMGYEPAERGSTFWFELPAAAE